MLNLKKTNISLGARCSRLLEGEPPGPPYWLRKWASDVSNITSSRVVRREITHHWCNITGRCPGRESPDIRENLWLIILLPMMIVVHMTLSGLCFIWKSRGKSKDEDVFASPTRDEHPTFQFTRHHDDGPEIIVGQGEVIKQHPEDENYPGELRRRLRSSVDAGDRDSQDSGRLEKRSFSIHDTSTETLVASTTDSRAPSVSLQDHSADEVHEGLIELDWNGHRKAFFKPSTGEFFRIP